MMIGSASDVFVVFHEWCTIPPVNKEARSLFQVAASLALTIESFA